LSIKKRNTSSFATSAGSALSSALSTFHHRIVLSRFDIDDPLFTLHPPPINILLISPFIAQATQAKNRTMDAIRELRQQRDAKSRRKLQDRDTERDERRRELKELIGEVVREQVTSVAL
jgi:hypothetical protein